MKINGKEQEVFFGTCFMILVYKLFISFVSFSNGRVVYTTSARDPIVVVTSREKTEKHGIRIRYVCQDKK